MLSRVIKFVKRYHLLPTLAVFLFFFVTMGHLQFATPYFIDFDSHYHAKMALMIKDFGVLQSFPWLFFTTLHQAFVNQHFLFHVYLLPFVWLGGLFYGAKIAIVSAIALVFTLVYWLLKNEKAPAPLLISLLLLLAPTDFFFRLHMIRVQSVSLLFMLIGIMCLWYKKPILLFLVSFFYAWLYGGGFFLPLIVLIYLGLDLLYEHKLDVKLLIGGIGGYIAGFIINPYFPKNINYLFDQVFVTGLGYTQSGLNVGGEWRPYDTWYIFDMSLIYMILIAVTLFFLLFLGKKLSKQSMHIWIIQCLFLVLMWKSKRFVEYWPLFALLSVGMSIRDIARSELFEPIAKKVGSILVLGLIIVLKYFNPYQANTNFYQLAQKVGRITTDCLVVIILGLILTLGYFNLQKAKADFHPPFSEADTENIMTCIQSHSMPGDIVFTDDWDIFTGYFFYNTYNHFIVGLDPAFMHRFNPLLYKQFADITMGKDRDDIARKISTVFQARYVVIDRDHREFRASVESSGGAFSKICENPTYTGYHIN